MAFQQKPHLSTKCFSQLIKLTKTNLGMALRSVVDDLAIATPRLQPKIAFRGEWWHIDGALLHSIWNYNSHKTTTFECPPSRGPKVVTTVKWQLLHLAIVKSQMTIVERQKLHSQRPPNYNNCKSTTMKWKLWPKSCNDREMQRLSNDKWNHPPHPAPKSFPCRSLHSTMQFCRFPYKGGGSLGGGLGKVFGRRDGVYENLEFPLSQPRVSQSPTIVRSKTPRTELVRTGRTPQFINNSVLQWTPNFLGIWFMRSFSWHFHQDKYTCT